MRWPGENLGRPHQTLFWRSGPFATLPDGDFKLQVMDKPPAKLWLHDIATNPHEKTNLVAANQAETARLVRNLRGISASQAKPLWPSLALCRTRWTIPCPTRQPK